MVIAKEVESVQFMHVFYFPKSNLLRYFEILEARIKSFFSRG